MIYFVLINVFIIAVLVGGLSSTVPNSWAMLRRDVMARGNYYQNYRTMEEAQLAVRSGRLKSAKDELAVNDAAAADNSDCLVILGEDCTKVVGTVGYSPTTKQLSISISENHEKRSAGGES
ncbi:MAG: hypothetical protein GX606_02290 [Elusimicrobia bacterium]|nr:hypothetical protein [Elusimicrobiota bacterium]